MHPHCVPLYVVNINVSTCPTGLAEMRDDTLDKQEIWDILGEERNIEEINAFVASSRDGSLLTSPYLAGYLEGFIIGLRNCCASTIKEQS